MQSVVSRGRLLAGAALGLGFSMMVPQQAMASCTVTATALDCTTTTTTSNTLNAGVSPASDRGFSVVSTATPFAGTVNAGAIVDGYGLGIDDSAVAGAGITFVNDGTIQVDPGLGATVNGTGALGLWVDSGDINYSGSGNIANLGIFGSGTWFQHSGTGNILGAFGGDVAGAADYTGIFAEHIGTSGNIDIDTTAGRTISGGFTGIWLITSGTLAGNIDLTNNSAIQSIAGDPLERGIVMQHLGTGDNLTLNNGTIGSATDRMVQQGILAQSTNAASTGLLSVTGTGAIWSVGDGIFASNAGTGATTVNYSGSINTLAGDAIQILNSGAGAIGVTTMVGQTLAASGGDGIKIDSAGAGNVTVLNNAAIGSGGAGVNTLQDGITVETTGTGNVTVTNNGAIGTALDRAQLTGITATINNPASTGTVGITGTGDIFSVGNAIDAATNGNLTGIGNITINYGGALDSLSGDGIQADTSIGDITVTSGGAITAAAGDGIDISTAIGDETLTVNGPITAQLNGINASTAAGDQTITTNGAITAQLDGINASTSIGDQVIDVNGIINAQQNGVLASTGIGDQTITVDGAITAVLDGINATSTSGNLGVTVNAAIQSQRDGVSAAMYGNIDIVNNSTISSAIAPNTLDNGINATSTSIDGDIAVSNLGAIGTAGDRAQLTGISESITTAVSTGTLSASGTGAIFSVGNAIDLSTIGTGAASVVYGGAIDTTTGDGVQVNTTSGALTVATSGAINAAAGDGIQTGSISGNQTINVAGNVTAGATGLIVSSISGTIDVGLTGGADIAAAGTDGILAISSGAKTVTIGAGSVVTGAARAIAAGGGSTLTVNNSGTAGTAGTAAVYSTDFITTAAVNNLAGGVLNGRVDLSSGNDSVTNAGTWNADGTSFFYGGTDVISNQSGGVLNIAAGTSFTGLDTLNSAGTVNATFGVLFDGDDTSFTNTGTANVAGIIDFGGGIDAFANTGAGIFNLTGNTTLANAETITNSGRINLDVFTLTGPAIAFTNTGTIDTNGNAGLAGFTAFSNGGTLDLAAGTFTVPATVFANGGTILADEGASSITGQTNFANSGTIDLQDNGIGDVLTIDSGFAGGGFLLVDFDQTVADNLVINGTVTGSTIVNANYFGSGVINSSGILVVDTDGAGADAFVLGSVTGGSSSLIGFSLLAQGDDFFLFATPNALAFQPVLVGAVTQDIWYQSADAYSSYGILRRSDLGAKRKSNIGLWGQVYGSNDRYGHKDTQNVFGFDVGLDNTVKTDRRGVQAGVDFLAGDRFVVGVTGGHEHAKSNNQSVVGGVEAEGYNVGAYAQFGGATGFYAGLLAKADWNDVRLTNSAFNGADGDPDSKNMGVEGEAGFRTNSLGFGLDLGAGLAYVRTKVDGFSAGGIGYDFERGKSLRGRLGARGEFGGSLGVFADARLYHEFEGDNELTLTSGSERDSVEIEGRGTWARFETGFGSRMKAGPMLSAWVDVGDVTGLGIRGGFRF